MPRFRLFTPAEHRLAVLLLVLTLMGLLDVGVDHLSPEVRAWLESPPPPPEVEMVPDSPTAAGRTGKPALLEADEAAVPADPGVGDAGRGAETRGLRINPNRASQNELEALPGIGPSLASRIVGEREQGGPFRAPEDLLRVRGIGPATLARLRPFLELP